MHRPPLDRRLTSMRGGGRARGSGEGGRANFDAWPDIQREEGTCPIRDTNKTTDFARLRLMALRMIQRDEAMARQ